MWFKNLLFFHLEKPFTYSPEELEKALNELSFIPCGKHELSSMGWSSPMGNLSEMRVHAAAGAIMICAKKEERILPASVIRDFVNDKVEAIEESEMRKVRKKERDTLKDEVILDLTPKAFTRSSQTYAIILPRQSLLILDTTSPKKVDEFTTLLRKTLVDTPLRQPQVKTAPAATLTLWLSNPESAPDDLEIGDECELLGSGEEASLVRCRRQDLASKEITAHIDAGKSAVKLSMTWNEKLSFLLAEDLSVKKLKYSDELVEEAAEKGDADAAAKFDADFTLMALEFGLFIPRLLELLGGGAEE